MSTVRAILQEKLINAAKQLNAEEERVAGEELVQCVYQDPDQLKINDADNGIAPLQFAAENNMWNEVILMVDALSQLKKDIEAVKSHNYDPSKVSAEVSLRLSPLIYRLSPNFHLDPRALNAINLDTHYFESIAAGKVLLKALKTGKSVATKMLMLGVSASWRDSHKNTCLHWAVEHNLFYLIPDIIRNGCKIDQANSSGLTALQSAIRNHSTECVEEIFKNIPAKDKADKLKYALYEAIEYSHLQVVKKLREQGAAIPLGYFKNDDDYINYMTREFARGMIELITDPIELIQDTGKNIDLTKKQPDFTIFDLAVFYDKPAILEFLINEADKDIRSHANPAILPTELHKFFEKLSWSLIVACRLNKQECILVIAAYFKKYRHEFARANLNNHQLIAKHLEATFANAIRAQSDHVVDLLLGIHREISLRLSIFDIANHIKHSTLKDVGSVLHYLARNNDAGYIKKILSATDIQNIRNSKGHYPIDTALLQSSWDAARALIEDKSFHVTFASQLASYARCLAHAGQFSLLDLLLQKKARINVNEKDEAGNSLLHLIAANPAFTSLGLLDKHMPNYKLKNTNKLMPYQVAMAHANFKFLTLMYQSRRLATIDYIELLKLFSLAVSNNQPELVALILKDNPELCHFYNKNGNAYLNKAAKEGWREMLNVLLRGGANAFAATKDGISFVENVHQNNLPVDPRLLNDLENEKIKLLSAQTASNFNELLKVNSKNTYQLIQKITLDNILMLKLVHLQLKSQQKQAQLSAAIPSNLTDDTSPQLARLIKLYEQVVTKGSSSIKELDQLAPLKTKLAGIELSEAKVLSQFIDRMLYIHSAIDCLRELNNSFCDGIQAMAWQKAMMFVYIDGKPKHIKELEKKIKNKFSEPPVILANVYNIGHTYVIYELIRDELKHAVEPGTYRHPSTDAFYEKWCEKYDVNFFSSQKPNAVLIQDLYHAVVPAQVVQVDPSLGVNVAASVQPSLAKVPPTLYPLQESGMPAPTAHDHNYPFALPIPSAPAVTRVAVPLYPHAALGFEYRPEDDFVVTTIATTTTETSTLIDDANSRLIKETLEESQLTTVKVTSSVESMIQFEDECALDDSDKSEPETNLPSLDEIVASAPKPQTSSTELISHELNTLSYQIPKDAACEPFHPLYEAAVTGKDLQSILEKENDLGIPSLSNMNLQPLNLEDQEEESTSAPSPSALRVNSLLSAPQASTHVKTPEKTGPTLAS